MKLICCVWLSVWNCDLLIVIIVVYFMEYESMLVFCNGWMDRYVCGLIEYKMKKWKSM